MNATVMNTFNIGDKIERISGDARNRGIVIEIDEEKQRARIDWTDFQPYEFVTTERNRAGEAIKFKTVWSGEFKPFTSKQPRTWSAFKFLKVVN